jgi:peptide-methionine (S)-S-oxide reductase
MGWPRVEREQYRRKRAHFNRTAAASRRHRTNVSRIAATEDGKMPYIARATTRLRQPREDRVRRPTNRSSAGRRIGLGLVFSLGLFASAAGQGSAPEKAATATFAGGCFWCVEADFDKVEGVISTTSGYTGGRAANPSYEEVSRGGTGHAEAVEIVYDPAKVSYEKLLDVFWHNIDPLAKDRQFCDHGDQYRSAIFYHGDEQRALAEASKAAVAKRFKQPIQTAILPAGPFYKAEEYHQDYYVKNPIRYKFYRFNCGRDARLEELWGKKD